MPEQEEYVIEIYASPKGVVVDTVVNGKLEYLQAKMFLNMLTERTYKPEHMPRPIPERSQDWYELTMEQLSAYSQFLKRLRGKAPSPK
jgi:hypothetical protein